MCKKAFGKVMKPKQERREGDVSSVRCHSCEQKAADLALCLQPSGKTLTFTFCLKWTNAWLDVLSLPREWRQWRRTFCHTKGWMFLSSRGFESGLRHCC